MQNTAFEFGVKLACVLEGITPEQVELTKSAAETLRAHASGALANGVDNFLCAVGHEIFAEAGAASSPLGCLFKRAAQANAWNPAVGALARVVSETLAEESKILSDHHGHEKAASLFGRLMLPVAGKATALTPDLLKAVLGGAVITGGAGGALAFMLNQHAQKDEDENEVMKARIAYYDRLAQEMQDKAARALDGEVEDLLAREGV